jgi:hypothetical protein
VEDAVTADLSNAPTLAPEHFVETVAFPGEEITLAWLPSYSQPEVLFEQHAAAATTTTTTTSTTTTTTTGFSLQAGGTAVSAR